MSGHGTARHPVPLSKPRRNHSGFRAAPRALGSYDGVAGRNAATVLAGSQVPASREVDVKELSLEEVLRIAGGVPLSAALDELTYRAPEGSVNDPVDYARLLGTALRSTEPT